MTQELRKLAEAVAGEYDQMKHTTDENIARAHTFQAFSFAAANPAAILALLDRMEKAEKERDALQAKLDELQRQEPVGRFVSDDDCGHIDLVPHQGQPMVDGQAVYAAPKALEPITDERQPLTKVLAAVREYLPPDGISAKDCLSKIIAIVDPWPLDAKPLIAMKDVELSLMAHNDDLGDWNDLRYRDCWHEGYKAGARATEAAHGITKGTPT